MNVSSSGVNVWGGRGRPNAMDGGSISNDSERVRNALGERCNETLHDVRADERREASLYRGW
jgi:hypothetical protein